MEHQDLPKTIKGVVQPDWYSTSLKAAELPLPKPKSNSNSEEHLIKVYATSPCARELHWGVEYPHIISSVKCLVVSAPPSSPFQPGSEIYTRTTAARDGNLREYTIAITSELALKPKSLTWEEAASVPLSAFTAYQALFEHGGFDTAFDDEVAKRRNTLKSLLVTGAAEGVGVWMLQLAKAVGIGRIIAVSGPDKINLVKSLGATDAINYREQTIVDWISSGHEKIDIAFDVVSGQTLRTAWESVTPGGKLIAIGPFSPNDKPENVSENVSENVEGRFFIMQSHGWQLDYITDLLDKKIARPVIDSVWTYKDFQKAFDQLESGHSKGKVIIKSKLHNRAFYNFLTTFESS